MERHEKVGLLKVSERSESWCWLKLEVAETQTFVNLHRRGIWSRERSIESIEQATTSAVGKKRLKGSDFVEMRNRSDGCPTLPAVKIVP